ncbi:MAG TPA: N,N-dimethylformamidase beta subunit family domain-containing protein [Mycobacteriales bacterium]|nr:N,N-dimethylformamidase beta subunit family domain-containing protein [Mycobacteriales bacterium]
MRTDTRLSAPVRLSRHRWLSLLFVAAVAAASLLTGSTRPALAAGACDPGSNPIVCENSKAGTPSSVWDVSGGGDTSVEGFATDMSVNAGSPVNFKIEAAVDYGIDIYRVGYYGGNGARKVATVSRTGPLAQPACLTNEETGLIDCGNWSVSATWSVPADAVSGVYFANLVRKDNGSNNHVVFVVRNDASRSDVLVQTSDTTWQAYNDYGGNSLYVGAPGGRAFKVSYNRPFHSRITTPEGRDFFFSAEYSMVRWLEANGYDTTYTTGIDSDRRGALIKNHKVFVSVGHDEYWSGAQRANVEAARDAGVNLAFFSGNEVYWKTRWEPSIDASGTPYRTLVSYKETKADAKLASHESGGLGGAGPPAAGARDERERRRTPRGRPGRARVVLRDRFQLPDDGHPGGRGPRPAAPVGHDRRPSPRGGPTATGNCSRMCPAWLP